MTFDYKSPDNNNGAPFNMAIATLMRLDEILKEYKKVSMSIALGDFQDESKAATLSVKVELAKQFYLNSVPLIPCKTDEEKAVKIKIKEQMRNLKMPTAWQSTNNNPSNMQKELVEIFDPLLNNKIDEFIENVSEVLQGEGYFMPPKNDPRFSFRRS